MSLIKGLIPGRILEGLARYRFLTIQQLVRLGVGEEKGVRIRLQDLMTAKLIDRQEFRLGPSAGRLPNMHWLTPKGARFVAEAIGTPVEPPRAREINAAHAWHRMLVIDTLMACDTWAERTDQAWPVIRSYMQWRGNSPITGVALPGKQAIADAILETTDAAGNCRVYVLEVYCSQYSEGRSSFPLEQLEPFVLAGMGNALDEALHIPANGKAGRILVVCDTVDLRDRLLRRLPERPGMPPREHQGWRRFHFKAADELHAFGADWHTVAGDRIALPA
ncbi:replication-relaxation family protein [Sinorhizobium fredii]|uniref:Uncharacterized protein n=1 Tax=Sinorhizobium fredii (strain HH103) TaxID=1117943 RepID=A0A0A8WH94_SINF1|nr:replication-relaxation family protein [Sinorhizobium fredii]CEL26558.1 hypothetical protein [Sinorhizobium fredii HH103]